MVDLKHIIAKIKELLQEDSKASVTYAALEARLALEKVCYDRLRQRHDYISHSELKEWQPSALINRLLQDVDPHIGQTITLHVSKSPAVPGVEPNDDDFVEIGTETGFNSKRIARLWNALSKLALHVRLPENKEDRISPYGNKERISAKVRETLTELERLATGTMTFSGVGKEISFSCSCGTKNKRKADMLRDGQHVHCLNPDCKNVWRALKCGEDYTFEPITIPINCNSCGTELHLPWRWFFDMKYDEYGAVDCSQCGNKNYVQWRLCQVSTTEPLAPS